MSRKTFLIMCKRHTYTSRIDELDQMGPWDRLDAKALPARPDSDIEHRPSMQYDESPEESESILESATLTRIVTEDDHSPPPLQLNGSSRLQLRDTDAFTGGLQVPSRPFEAGLLQSSFSRSPMRQRFPEDLYRQRPDHSPHLPPPSPFLSHSPSGDPLNDFDGVFRADYSQDADRSRGNHNNSRQTQGHIREDSQNSWLDPIDESAGSSASSIHSRTSSLGYRRRHIRAPSGDTEAEFDTALDAAIEAAYDDGYEPMQAHDFDSDPPSEEIVANALRKVELARERVRQTELEAYGTTTDRERQRQPPQKMPLRYPVHKAPGNFFDDNSSEDEERMLEEMTSGYAIEDFSLSKKKQNKLVPRESDSSGVTSRTWPSSIGSNPATGATSLSVVTETITPGSSKSMKAPSPAPPLPAPVQALPELPPPQRRSPPLPPAQGVRSRRMSGQNPKELKIETAKLGPVDPKPEDVTHSKPTAVTKQELLPQPDPAVALTTALRRSASPVAEASPVEPRLLGSPFGHRGPGDLDEGLATRSASPSMNKLRKNVSSSSLRSMKTRNPSLSNLDDASDRSPGTPSSSQIATPRMPAVPALPTPLTASYREKSDASVTGGLYLFDNNFHAPETPGSPNPVSSDAPVALELCPEDFMLRPFWLMRCLYQTLAHPRGGYLTTKLFVPRDVWRVKGVKLRNVEDKIANCDLLTAALLKLAKVDTCDADAMLEEMQSLEGVLEQVQSALSRKLGNEVGVQGSGALFKDATSAADVDSNGVPRSGSLTSKSSSFSWRRLRSKNSAAGLGGSYNGRFAVADGSRELSNLASLPMTANPTSRPAKREIGQTHFTGPNGSYMGSLARLFDAAQAIGKILSPLFCWSRARRHRCR